MALGVLVFGWMNAVAQPCLMDMPMSAEMPAAAMHGEHGGHDMNHEPADADCGHCPSGGDHASADCLTIATADCEATADLAVDGRTIKLESGNLADDDDTALSITDPPPGRTAYIDDVPDCRPWILPAGPALNLQYCVFLK